MKKHTKFLKIVLSKIESLAKKSRKFKLVKSERFLSLTRKSRELNPLLRILSSKRLKKFVFGLSHPRNVNALLLRFCKIRSSFHCFHLKDLLVFDS